QPRQTNISIQGTYVFSENNKIIVSGISTSSRFSNSQISSGTKSGNLTNSNLKAVSTVGGSISFTNCDLQPLGARNQENKRQYFITLDESNSGKVRLEYCSILYPDLTQYFIYNGGTNTNTAEVVALSVTGTDVDTLIGSTENWNNVSVDFCQFFVDQLATPNVDFTKNDTNGIINKSGKNVNAVLPAYNSREEAIGAGMKVGDLFLNKGSSENKDDWILDIVL